MAKDKESASQEHSSLANETYRTPPSCKLATLEEWQAYQKAEVIMWEFVEMLMHFNVMGRPLSPKHWRGLIPNRVYYFLRDTVMKILLNRCELTLIDGDWMRDKPSDELEKALGSVPRQRKKRRFWDLFKKWR